MASDNAHPRRLFELSQLLHVEGRFAVRILRSLDHMLGLERINTLYAGLPPHQPREFFQLFLDDLGVALDFDTAELAHLPATGACVLVANHPFGMADGIALGALLARVRPDFKFLGNFMLDRVPDMAPFNIPVDPFSGTESRQRNIAPLRATMRWLAAGGALVLFPAGEVAHYQPQLRGISDPPWQENLARVLRRAHAPVLPVFFAGTNSLRFHLLGLLHPRLRTVLLGTELVNKGGKTLRIRMGAPISPERIAAVPGDAELLAYLRAETYALAAAPPPATGPAPVTAAAPLPAVAVLAPEPAELELPGPLPPEPIAPPESSPLFCAEIAALPTEALLCACGEFQVYWAEAAQIPHLLREIGRQREISFRQVGEGTGKALDLDHFDQYYQHLFLWNREKCELIGAYRIGMTDVIVRQYGISGLYTSTLFRYDASLLERTGPMLELGRSFIRPEYQRTHATLYLLWRGIGLSIARNPQYRYLFGAVSISADYTTMSRQLMTAFLTANHLWEDLTTCVAPLHPLALSSGEAYHMADSLDTIADLDALSTLVLELEHGQRGIPILLKHYLRIGGRLLGFNIDPQFSNVIDGLILVDLLQAPPRVIEKYISAEHMQVIRAYHQHASAIGAHGVLHDNMVSL